MFRRFPRPTFLSRKGNIPRGLSGDDSLRSKVLAERACTRDRALRSRSRSRQGPRNRKNRCLRRLLSRTKEGRDALRSSEAHPQARSVAPPWPKRSQRRVPPSRHSPKSAETGEAHSAPGADLRHMRPRGSASPRLQLSLSGHSWPIGRSEGREVTLVSASRDQHAP